MRLRLQLAAVLSVAIAPGVVRTQSETEGYLCDKFCWQLPGSVALDGARMRTNPERHTVHCMRDVSRCRESGFVILQQVDGTDGEYKPVYQLDDGGNEQALALLDTTTAVRDFQVVITGRLVNANASLPTIATASVSEAPGPQAPRLRGEFPLFLHFLLMICSWGALLPWGVALASRTRGVAEPAWFVSHRRLQLTGWTLQLLGFCAALWYCQVYSTHFASPHTKIGLTVVVLGTLQPLNAYFRPHPLSQSKESLLRRAIKGEPHARKRFAFECLHKGGGWTAVLLGMWNVVIGVGLIYLKGYDGTTVGVAFVCACLAGGGIVSFYAYRFCVLRISTGLIPPVLFFIASTCRKDNAWTIACLRCVGGAKEAIRRPGSVGAPKGP